MDGRKEQEKRRLRKSKKKGLRVGCGSVAASERCVSCTTFNILAPIYKRLSQEDQSCRESQYKAYWLNRNEKIIDQLLVDRSSIICLQEVWLGNEELVQMYEKRLGDAGYISFKLARTNNRGDGLLTAMRQDYFRVINYRELLFNDFGDRVAQLLRVESAVALWQGQACSVRQQILIVNTHLLFPHDFSLCIVRLQQVYKILQYIETYQKEHNLDSMPIILCGDWNGSKRGHVYKFLRSQGFLSSYDTVHRYSDVDAHKWVSHRNHRGNVCGVDFIWLLNPNKFRKPLRTSWNEAVFCLIKSRLRAASLTEDNAFAFLKMDNPFDYITYSSFCQALHQLGLSSHPHGLSPEDTKGLWAQADTDGNGIIDFEEFQQQIWNPKCFEKAEEETILETKETQMIQQQTFGFNVKDAILFPPEVERGMWPENYSLSDHAPLTVVFSPVKIPCGQPVC
ncbi:putative calcium-binding protein At1g02270 [Curcuma longa]|uniref:putative calcium-binding protein At1g02270 n=1 Tax=Curcuma longa TaxID=136217 RepID=UPI003D9F880C